MWLLHTATSEFSATRAFLTVALYVTTAAILALKPSAIPR
jgi:hypothetical protein